MLKELSESNNPYERLSPRERQYELEKLLGKLPNQLTKGEAQIIENLGLLNTLTKLLKFSKGNPEFVTFQLRQAAHATEFGVEALRDVAEVAEPEASMFPGTVLVDVGLSGQFDDPCVQVPEHRELLRLGKKRASQRFSHGHLLYVGWSISYQKKYGQAPDAPVAPLIQQQEPLQTGTRLE